MNDRYCYDYMNDLCYEIILNSCIKCRKLPLWELYRELPHYVQSLGKFPRRIFRVRCEGYCQAFEIIDTGFSSMVELLVHWNKINPKESAS